MVKNSSCNKRTEQSPLTFVGPDLVEQWGTGADLWDTREGKEDEVATEQLQKSQSLL